MPATVPMMIVLMLLAMMVMLVSFRRLAMVVAIRPLGLIGVVTSLLVFNRPRGFLPSLYLTVFGNDKTPPADA
jgi:multidrug efflux pump subunit AcrB